LDEADEVDNHSHGQGTFQPEAGGSSVPRVRGTGGQTHTNTGYQREAGRPGGLVRDLVEVFEYARSRALWRVVAKTYELSQLPVEMLAVTGVGASYPHRVTWLSNFEDTDAHHSHRVSAGALRENL
jgi:hypothetical protein